MTKRTYLYLTSGIKDDTIYFVKYRIKGMEAHMIEPGRNIIIDSEHISFKDTSIKIHYSKIIEFRIKV